MNSDLTTVNSELGISSDFLAARCLSECQEASDLEVAEVGADGKEHLLVPAAASAWRSLKAAALTDGVPLFVVSASRSVDRQVEIVRRRLEAGASVEEVLSVCAPPGFSEHHTGCAVDVSTPGSPILQVEFEQTTAFAWLGAHAADFNYYLSYPVGNHFGYQYEPWHWCFNNAQRGAIKPRIVDMYDENDLIYSPLQRSYSESGKTIDICLYRMSETGWTAEVVDQHNNSTVWDGEFESDQAALDEVLKDIQEEGIEAFIGTGKHDDLR